mgnify:FL=1
MNEGINCGFNIEMKIKEAIQESRISLRELERKTGIERHYLKTIQELPADEILLHEIVLIADALGKDIKDLFVVETVTII